ncbi:hypothetical protein ACH5RR_016176 [Cinchona calisaya]|uniref:DUF538 domain-containing protein n=1 Tax=Cinchona calisaya TaxID=153742 RepID=A0ABD2ZXX5_9GENT
MSPKQLIETHRENAEMYSDPLLCKEKSRELLEKMHFPKGLLPLDELIEVGYNESTGFIWMKQKQRKEHKFRAIGRTVSYDNEVTAFLEDRQMKKLTGVKSKELLLWITVSDIYIEAPNPQEITFKNPTGLSRTFPTSAFEDEVVKEEN